VCAPRAVMVGLPGGPGRLGRASAGRPAGPAPPAARRWQAAARRPLRVGGGRRGDRRAGIRCQ
jgi:hypothetical protein